MYKRILVTAVVLALSACSKDAKEAEAKTETAPAMQFKDNTEKALYGVAVRMGQQMKSNLDSVKELGITANNEMLFKGYQDGLAGTPGLKDEEVAAALEAFSKELQEKQMAQVQKTMGDNKAKADAFLAEFDKQDGVTKTESGLRYKVVTAGDGKAKPNKDDTVEVHYRGTLIDGTEFDSSYKREKTAEFVVSQVIPGWTEALQLMSKGAKFQLAIPADIAYGERQAGQIPPGSTLLFDVELINIKKAN